MKIDELNQNPAVSHLVNGRIDKFEAADAHGEAAGKQQAAADRVDLSSYIPVVPTSQKQQDLRANRLAELKSQIESGSYHVPVSAVAEKMLSKIVMRTSH